MKNISIKIALFLFAFTATTANAQSKTAAANENVLLSFQAGNPQASNARLIIRNSAGFIVKSKSFTANYCNIEKSVFGLGNYTFTIINGNKSCQGLFSIK